MKTELVIVETGVGLASSSGLHAWARLHCPPLLERWPLVRPRSGAAPPATSGQW